MIEGREDRTGPLAAPGAVARQLGQRTPRRGELSDAIIQRRNPLARHFARPRPVVLAVEIDQLAPAELEAQGWRPGSVKPGHKVELEVNPSLDGSASGYVHAARKGNGKPIGRAASS